jgi:hypothetical protein
VQPSVSATPSPLGGVSEPLYSSLTASSTPQQIAEAYAQFVGGAGGDTKANQDAAREFLESRGIAAPTIGQAYNEFAQPQQVNADAVSGALSQVTSVRGDDAMSHPNDSLAPTNLDRYEVRTEQGPYSHTEYEGGPAVYSPDVTRYFDKTTGKEVSANEYRAGTGQGNTVDKLTSQILGQGITDKWTGQAFGSAAATAEDIAKRLDSIGITDINQFGKVDAYQNVYEMGKTYNGQRVGKIDPNEDGNLIDATYDPDRGWIPVPAGAKLETIYGQELQAAGDDYGTLTPVNSSDVTIVDGKPVIKTGQTFGNKVTGEALDPNYAFAGGNIFSGTFAGKGRTGYGVQFADDGTPYFYTAYGGSSNDLAQLMEDPIIGTVVQAAASYFGGPLGTAALNLAAGREPEDVAKAALTSWVAGEVGKIVSGAPSVIDAVGQTGANIAGRVAGSVVTGGGKDGAFQTLLTGGVGAVMPEIQSMIPGYEDLPPFGKEFVNNAIASTLRDGDLSQQDLINAAVRAGTVAARTSAGGTTGGITNRTYDDTITQAGADAFLRAKEAGASDEDAMDAANAVTGVQINPIDAGGPNLSTTTTYDPRAATVDTNFGDLQGAIETNAINDAMRADRLDLISQAPRFSDAYSQARELLGPNQTFTWNGKQYSTATAEERPDLSAPKVQPATDQSAAETARLTAQNTALVTGNAPDQSAAETARLANLNAGLKSMEKTGFLGQIYKDLNEQFRLQGVAANEYLKNNPNSPITQSVSSAFEAAGELQKNLGGIPLAFDNKPLADIIISGGSKLQALGQSLGDGPQDTKNWNDTVDLISKAKGTEKLAVLAGRIMDGTSGLARQIGVELRQEIPALFLGGGLLRPTMIASGLIDVADTGGAAVIEAYDDVVKKGGTHAEGLSAGRKAGAAAAATEAVIQATMGKLGDFAAGKLDNVLSKGTTKIGSEGVVGGTQEAGSSAAVDLALGNAIDVNKAITQGVLGTAVSKGAATATSGIDAAQTDSINNIISTAVASNNPETVNSVITNSVQTSLNSGASVEVAVGNTVGAAITNGADAAVSIDNVVTTAIENGADTSQVVASTITSAVNAGSEAAVAVDSSITAALNAGGDPAVVIDSAVTAAVNAGASVDTTLASAVSSAVNAGADVNTVVQAATDAAVSTGNDVTVTSDANTVTINNATTNTDTTVDAATGVTTTVDNANNVTTVVDGNTTTVVDANTNTTSQTTVDTANNTQTTVVADAATNTNTETVVDTKTNTTTSTTVDTNNNTTTQTTINQDTQTTVLTDTNNNTQTTVKLNVNTGDVIEVKEAEIPPDWKQPVVETPVVPQSVTPPTVVSPEATPPATVVNQVAAAPKLAPKLTEESRVGANGVGLPVGMDLKPASLRSRETQKAIDPLARVKEIQAEFERDAMIQNVDPRLMQILQQRSDPQQQSQQFDKDIGALARLLGGEPEAPNTSNYYSYGSEDSIDDILGGRAANYKEGGYVEPLKASGGSMALPLLAKSGGALGHYQGRENFKEGKHVAGKGDGQSDDIPAWLADGEFVFPADVVSALGNGSTKAGTDKLYEMMHGIRDRARSKGPKDLPPPALKSPLDYLKSSKRSTS